MQSIFYKKGYYEVRLATSKEDLSKLSEFKKTHLNTEKLQEKTKEHLLIIDKRRNDVVGVFGIICSSDIKEFLAKGTYHLNELEKAKGKKIELCYGAISKRTDEEIVTQVLWSGLKSYGVKMGARFLFGCIPVRLGKEGITTIVLETLGKLGRISPSISLTPYTKLGLYEDSRTHSFESLFHLRGNLNPQLNFLLNSGAQICGLPGFHDAYECPVVPTLLSLNHSQILAH